MIPRFVPALRQERRAALLAAITLLQALCAIFFVTDVIIDLYQGDDHDTSFMALEVVAALALCAGVIFLMLELRNLTNRMMAMELGLRAARGEMAHVIDMFFDEWNLTPSERDVALLVLKGVDNESIATMRGTASGTVRAQCTRIYAKAKVDGRAQLLSVFVEELLHSGDDN